MLKLYSKRISGERNRIGILLTEVPFISKTKRNEWQKKSMLIGVIGGLNAGIWGILINHWVGLV